MSHISEMTDGTDKIPLSLVRPDDFKLVAMLAVEEEGPTEDSQDVAKILQKAVELGDEEKVKALLQECFKVEALHSGAQDDLLSVRDLDGNSVLHLAVMSSQANIVTILRKEGKLGLDARNNLRQTPLHLFHCVENSHCNYSDHNCLDTLLLDLNEEMIMVNAQDNDGNTPLHLAVKHKCAYCIQSLLNSGAEFNIKSKGTKNSFVTPRIFDEYPWAGDILENRLNKVIAFEQLTRNENTQENPCFRILMDFSQIISKSENEDPPHREMEFLATFLMARSTVRKQILGHPLVSNFIFFKSERVQRLFMLSLILHIFLAIGYTTFALTIYLKNCPYIHGEIPGHENDTLIRVASTGICDKGLGSVEFSIFLLVVAVILLFLEVIKFIRNKFFYLKTWRNIFQLFMIICMILTVWPVSWTSRRCLYNWQYSSAAYGIFHVWSTLMINVGRFPRLGIYVEMFGKVLRNFGFLMMAYVFLMIAFSVSFCVIFPDYPPFETIPRAILKVITMMSGEVDYKDFFYGDHKDKEAGNLIFKRDSTDLIHPMTAHLLYGAFVILVTIVLTNLLIGLAVDDIKALQQDAEFTKTKREVENIDYVESLIFWNSTCIYWIANWKLVKWLRNSIFLGRLRNSQRKGSLMEIIIGCVEKFFHWSKDNRATSNPLQKPASLYAFVVSREECKAPRFYPDEILSRTVELINKSNKHSKKACGNEDDSKSQHCKTCRCRMDD